MRQLGDTLGASRARGVPTAVRCCVSKSLSAAANLAAMRLSANPLRLHDTQQMASEDPRRGSGLTRKRSEPNSGAWQFPVRHRRRIGPLAENVAAQAFWDFSLALYEREEVQRLFLALQDEHGFDVNMLLLCLWVADAEQRCLDRRSINRLRSATEVWMTEVVIPLRAIRRQLKNFHQRNVSTGEAETCRGIMKHAEIEGERIEQLIMVRALELDILERRASRRAAAEASFSSYAEARAAQEALPALLKLIEAIFQPS